VQFVQVFGVPDHRLGEEVFAFVALRTNQWATAEEIQSSCRGGP
jgi:acyl-CoA synthetase (AMP-forming)/AMP-acid ligase II